MESYVSFIFLVEKGETPVLCAEAILGGFLGTGRGLFLVLGIEPMCGRSCMLGKSLNFCTICLWP